MRRRTAGLTIVAVAVLAAVIVPNLGERAVPGRPQAWVVPPPPRVGDCLTTPASLVWTQDGRPALVPRPGDVLDLAPCDGERFGEVSAVLATPTMEAAHDGANATDSACQESAQRYQGIPEEILGGAQFRTQWFATLWAPSMPVHPDGLRRVAGQTWTACVTFPPPAGEALAGYRDPVRDAFRTGAPGDGWGLCGEAADIVASVPCGVRHTAEDFGWATDSSSSPAGEQDRLAGCRELVALVTRMPDATAGGALQITVVAEPAPDPANPLLSYRCRVVASDGRTLIGTLLGVGNRPVPWG